MKNRTDIDQLHDEIKELVDELWHLPRFAGVRRGFRPQADCIRCEDPAELRVIVELPGVDPATIKVIAAACDRSNTLSPSTTTRLSPCAKSRAMPTTCAIPPGSTCTL